MYDIERIIGCGYFTYVYIDIKDMHDDYVDPRVAFRLMKNENKNIRQRIKLLSYFFNFNILIF